MQERSVLSQSYNFPKTMQKMLTGWFLEWPRCVPPGIRRTRRPTFTSPLCFSILMPSSTGGTRETFYYLLKILWQRIFGEYWKAWRYHIGKAHSQPTTKPTDAGAEETGLLFPTSQGLSYRMLYRERQQLPKAQIWAAQKRQTCKTS